jgi:hypothetical protein
MANNWRCSAIKDLERWVAAHRTPQQVSQRCRIVLAAAQGQQDKRIADDLNLNFKTVALWRKRFVREGPDSLWEVAEGRGRKPTLTPEAVEQIFPMFLQFLVGSPQATDIPRASLPLFSRKQSEKPGELGLLWMNVWGCMEMRIPVGRR